VIQFVERLQLLWLYLARRFDGSEDHSLSLLMRFDMIDSFLVDNISHDHGVFQIATEQAQVLKSVYNVNSTGTGKHMEILWDMFKPPMPYNFEMFKYIVELEDLAEQFDRLRQRTFMEPKAIMSIVNAFRNTLFTLQQGNMDVSPDELIRDIHDVLRDIEGLEQNDNERNQTIFQSEFRRLYATFCLHATAHSSISKDLAECIDNASIFAVQKARSYFSRTDPDNSLPKFQVLGYFVTYAFELLDASEPAKESYTPFAKSLVDRLANTSQIQLRDLGQFKAELLLMGNILATGSASRVDEEYPNICRSLRMFAEVLSNIASQSGPENHTALPYEVEQMLEEVRNLASGTSQITPHNIGKGWIVLGVAYLQCYIPSRPFDPLMKRFLQSDFQSFLYQDFSTKISTLELAGSSFAEENLTFRSSQLRKKVANEGYTEQPSQDTLAIRPGTANFQHLYRDFSHILRLSNTLLERITGQKSLGDTVTLESLNQIRQRLESNYRGFDDIIQPLIGFLGFLVIGLSFEKNSNLVHSLDSNEPNSLLRLTMNLQPLSETVSITPTPVLLMQVERIVLNRMIESKSDLPISEETDEIIRELYKRWKYYIEKAQKENEANSSLYTFRGYQDDDDEENIAKELRELFSDADTSDEAPSSRITDEKDQIRHLVVTLCAIHNLLFQKHESFPRNKEYISHRIRDIVRNSGKELDRCSLTNSLPVVFLQMSEQLNGLDSSPLSTEDYNFYIDANLNEAKKMMDLTNTVRNRFVALRKAWPEHATISDVLKICSEIFDFKRGEPVIKFLTKCEKLHETIYQWQKVASKEYSASEIYDNLTALLVEWRRLELSTWARLLSFEMQKCLDDAKSWWFIAYENIIHVPEQISASDELSTLHIQKMIQIIQDFIESTSVGQFAARLDLLRGFVSDLTQRKQDFSVFAGICSALSNLVTHYDRFRSSVQNFVSKERAKLEKDIKEVVQLASWKDTNIDALRQSAKASHQKLFKVIRKFRKVLQQPASTIIEQGLPEDATEKNEFDPYSSQALPNISFDTQVSELCSKKFQDWATINARFRNIQVTVRMMQKIHSSSDTLCDGAAHVNEFLDEVKSRITSLRKETPSKLTAENKDIVKHLKVRKRTVFADTLKELRRMGFQYNLGNSILSKQDSVAKVLHKSATFNSDNQSKHIQLSDTYFHRIVDLMPQVRAISREHSGDLTSAEVVRSIGYFEGLLKCICDQRNVMAQALSEFERIAIAIASLKSICKSKDVDVQKSTLQFISNFLEHTRVVAHLAPMCSLFSDVLSAKSRLGQEDHTALSSALHEWSKAFDSMQQMMNQMKDLPPYLTTAVHQKALHDCKELLDKFTSEVLLWENEDSTIKPILDQLLEFTTFSQESRIGNNDEKSISLFELRQLVFGCVDSALASVQELESKQGELAAIDSEESIGWFIKEYSTRSSAVKALHINGMTRNLDNCIKSLAQLPWNDVPDAIFLLCHVQPIFQQYSIIVQHELEAYARLHHATCKFSYHLSSAFTKLGTEGFCTPTENTSGGDGGAEKIEEGTGLGDGEGAENISKDVGEDEDLTELAEQPNDKPDRDDLGSEEDAVDMADADLEGQVDDVLENDEEEQGDEGDSEDEAEEEVGDVDDLGPSAVDEKMWDSGETAEKDKQGEDAKGAKSEEVTAGADNNDQEADASEAEAPPDEPEAIGQEPLESTDPHLKESENLELPDDMNMDNQSQAGSMDSSVQDIPDDIGDMETETQDQNDELEQDDAMSMDSAKHTDDEMDDLDELENEDIKTSADTFEEGQEGEPELGLEEELNGSPEANNPPLPTNEDGDTANDTMEVEHSGGDLDANEATFEENGIGKTSNEDHGQGQSANTNPTNSAALNEEQDESDQQNGVGLAEESPETAQTDCFKRLGDVLEKWYNKNRSIHKPPDESRTEDITQDVDMTDVDFEHLPEEDQEGETQALGAATQDQARGIDFDTAEPQDSQHEPETFYEDLSRQADEQDLKKDEYNHEANPQNSGQQGSFMNKTQSGRDGMDILHDLNARSDHESDDDIDIAKISISDNEPTSVQVIEDSRALWTKHESSTRVLAAILAEQLRLILAPTLATKLRGDFRTGKRLNIKRIIPYIASSYKRDKIWMRRSVPSKRNYQIMIALDDSQSMADDQETMGNTKVDLAHQTLALIAKALSVLEAGDLCVVSFGEDLKVAHPFGKPFSDGSGPNVFQAFEFKQEKTDVKKLVRRATEMFRQSRRVSHGTAADLWQLLLVVSDGICEDHESIVRLVRQAQEERIMIVFVIVDKNSTNSKAESIMDLQTADFQPNETGDMKLVRKKYMDTFPFKWWLVVRDVKELPIVLSTALRQWFAEVVETVR
jgi:midasin